MSIRKKSEANHPTFCPGDPDSWIEISPKSGKAGDANVKITVKPNDSFEERTAVIQIKCGDTVKTITITQKQKDNLTVITDKIELGAEGGTAEVQLKTNIDFTYEIAGEWITYVSTKAYVEKTLSFNVAPNPTEQKREGSVTITGGEFFKKVIISQQGKTLDVIPVASVSLDKPAITLNEGDNNTLTATVLPSDATDKSVTWSTDNPNIATVDQAGKVTAVAAGEAVITVTTVDGNKTATCTVSVNKNLPAGSVTHGEWTGGQGSEAAI